MDVKANCFIQRKVEKLLSLDAALKGKVARIELSD